LHGRGADIKVLRVVGGAMKVGKQFFFEKKNQKTFSRRCVPCRNARTR
jgi:hypothetical protein